MRQHENLALYWLAVIMLAACFAAIDSTAWIGALIFLGGLISWAIYEALCSVPWLFWFRGKKKKG
jgi:hypothetical protein